MIIPKKTVCDICWKEIRIGDRVYRIKHKAILKASAGCIAERGNIELCEDCMFKFRLWLKEQFKEEKE